MRAHQQILSTCSSYFRDFLRDNPSKYPIVLLPMEIRYPELKAMIEFMYTGQVCVSQERLQAFIRGARYLRIKGLEGNAEDCGKGPKHISGDVISKIPEVAQRPVGQSSDVIA